VVGKFNGANVGSMGMSPSDGITSGVMAPGDSITGGEAGDGITSGVMAPGDGITGGEVCKSETSLTD